MYWISREYLLYHLFPSFKCYFKFLSEVSDNKEFDILTFSMELVEFQSWSETELHIIEI